MDITDYLSDSIELLINRRLQKANYTKEFTGVIEKTLGPKRYLVNYDGATREIRTSNNLLLQPLDKIHIIHPNGMEEGRYVLEDVVNNVQNTSFETRDLVQLSLVYNLTSASVKVYKNSNFCNLKIIANTGNWAANTAYNTCTLPVGFRPLLPIQKSIVLRTASSVAVSGLLIIETTGLVKITPMTAINGVLINIDEIYMGGQ